MIKLLESLFGCLHQRMTFPQSLRRVGNLNCFQRRGPTHVTCLGCGAEWEFNWEKLKRGKQIDHRSRYAVRETDNSQMPWSSQGEDHLPL